MNNQSESIFVSEGPINTSFEDIKDFLSEYTGSPPENWALIESKGKNHYFCNTQEQLEASVELDGTTYECEIKEYFLH